MSQQSDIDEFEGEDPGEGGLVRYNPIGEYYGGRDGKNERHGRGRAVLPSGDLYLGCYFQGKRYGLGVYRYKNGNGARYGGDWVNGAKHGWGTMYFPDGSQYTGNWYKGNIHGWGVYIYNNGDEYEGWFYMGTKNGRGIYRTKATNEKFVGSWLLGLKHGPGMLIRPEYRFIGNWYNDVPKGPGVYVFPDLGVEQHGRFTIVKMNPESIPKYKGLGYQILTMRLAPPPINPFDVEANTRMALQMTDMLMDAGEGEENDNIPQDNTNANQSLKVIEDTKGQGDADAKRLSSSAKETMDLKVLEKLKEFINSEQEVQEKNQTQVALVWRAMQITRLITKYPDETVPPPPIPETPVPEIESIGDDELDEGAQKKTSLDEDEAIRQAKLLAKTHALGEIYTGSGVCQLPLAKIRWPDDFIPPRTFSKITVGTIEEFKNVVESVAPQLEPLDIEAIIAENLNVFRGHGINVSDKWKECLGNETECENVELKGPPPQVDGPSEKRKSSQAEGSRRSSRKSEQMEFNVEGSPRGSEERRRSQLGEAEIEVEDAFEFQGENEEEDEYDY